MLFVILMLAELPRKVVYTFQDIYLPAQYIDEKSGYFLAMDEINYIYGATYGHGKGDVTQKAGRIANCTEGIASCKRLGEFVFVSSNRSGVVLLRKSGQRIFIRRTRSGGIQGSAVCYRFNENGCVTRRTENAPIMRYSYNISSKGFLERLRVQWLNETGVESRQDMIAITSNRLEIWSHGGRFVGRD